MDFAGFPPVPPLFISSFSNLVGPLADAMGPTTRAPASQNWPSANRAIYLPVTLPWPYTVRRVFWGNGSVAGNMDFGIYTKSGQRIYSTGSTAQTPTSGVQYVTPAAPILLPEGQYYFALANNGTANRSWSNTTTLGYAALGGMLTEASALPLPDPMTPASVIGTVISNLPLCGITRTTSGF